MAKDLASEILEGSARRPEQVFTPKAVVTREMFEKREEDDPQARGRLQEVLEEALLERGAQVVIYGDTGVGKTSLLKYASEDCHLKLLTVNCDSSDTFSSLVDKSIRKVVQVKEVRYSETRTTDVKGQGGLSIGGELPQLMSVKGSVKLGGGITSAEVTEVEVVEQHPLDVLTECMHRAGVDVLSFDNFQNMQTQSDRRLVAELMEHLSDISDDSFNLKIAVVGIADDIESLISDSGSFRRRISEICVPRMPDDEISAILTRGFGLLGIALDESILQRMVFYSDGFPYFAHLLGLATSRQIHRESKGDPSLRSVTFEHLDAAIRSAINSVDTSYSAKYKGAVEASGDTRPRATILDVLAGSPQREWTGPQVITAWSQANGERSSYEFLYSALGQLSGAGYGQVLKRKGSRTNYSYQFSDPYMRPYIRLLREDSIS